MTSKLIDHYETLRRQIINNDSETWKVTGSNENVLRMYKRKALTKFNSQ